jgi:hypothetical protein
MKMKGQNNMNSKVILASLALTATFLGLCPAGHAQTQSSSQGNEKYLNFTRTLDSQKEAFEQATENEKKRIHAHIQSITKGIDTEEYLIASTKLGDQYANALSTYQGRVLQIMKDPELLTLVEMIYSNWAMIDSSKKPDTMTDRERRSLADAIIRSKDHLPEIRARIEKLNEEKWIADMEFFQSLDIPLFRLQRAYLSTGTALQRIQNDDYDVEKRTFSLLKSRKAVRYEIWKHIRKTCQYSYCFTEMLADYDEMMKNAVRIASTTVKFSVPGPSKELESLEVSAANAEWFKATRDELSSAEFYPTKVLSIDSRHIKTNAKGAKKYENKFFK